MLSTVKCLDRDAFEPFVAAPADPDFERAVRTTNARLLPVPMRGLTDGPSMLSLRRHIKDLHIGLIHCHLGISSFLGLAAARPLGVPAVVTRHFIQDRYTTINNPLLRGAYLSMYRAMNKRFARIICVSRAVRDAVIHREKANPDKCVVIPNGVNLEQDAAISRDTPLPFPDAPYDAKRIFCVSRLAPEKGLDTLLQALADCVSQGRDIYLLVAGEGPLRTRLKQLARKLGVADRVSFPGFVHNIPDLMAACDAFVLPAVAEPFGIAVLEAMAAARPIVATAAGGPLEILEHNVSGLLTPPGNPAAMADAIMRILNQEEFAQSLGRNALTQVKQYDEHLIARRIQDVYLQALTPEK